jgi:hypothetical protein
MRRSARHWAGPWASYKLRNDAIVPLICPTCQNVFAGKESMPATTMLLCMGLFSMFWLEARAASALQLEKRGLPSRSSRAERPAFAVPVRLCFRFAQATPDTTLRPSGPVWLRHA